MRILICPTAFKGSLSAPEAARAMARGARRARPDAGIRSIPLSDGGPGLIEALNAASGPGRSPPRIERVTVRGPLDEPTAGRLLWIDPEEAVVESADACGLHLVGAGRPGAPLEAHSRGVGDLVRAAVERGAGKISIGLGGSATTDGGTGLGRAFGYRFLDARGRELAAGGGALRALGRIEPGRPPPGRFLALADVETPLNGMEGAARTFGPQKGATAGEVEILVRGLERLARCLESDLGIDVADLPGSGAAGGLGAGCAAFLGAEIVSGADRVLRRVGFEGALTGADIVVTGEGAFDASSRAGKIVSEVLRRADRAAARTLLVCGRIDVPVPEAAAAADGGGKMLDAETLAALVEDGIRRLRGEFHEA